MAKEERINFFNQHPQIQSMIGLAEAIVDFEQRIKQKFPNDFKMELAEFGEEIGLNQGTKVYIAKIYKYFLFGHTDSNTSKFEVYKTKTDLQLDLSKKKMEPQVIDFWARMVEEVSLYKKPNDLFS